MYKKFSLCNEDSDINVVMKQENEDSTEKPILDSSEGTYSLHSTL